MQRLSSHLSSQSTLLKGGGAAAPRGPRAQPGAAELAPHRQQRLGEWTKPAIIPSPFMSNPSPFMSASAELGPAAEAAGAPAPATGTPAATLAPALSPRSALSNLGRALQSGVSPRPQQPAAAKDASPAAAGKAPEGEQSLTEGERIVKDLYEAYMKGSKSKAPPSAQQPAGAGAPPAARQPDTQALIGMLAAQAREVAVRSQELPPLPSLRDAPANPTVGTTGFDREPSGRRALAGAAAQRSPEGQQLPLARQWSDAVPLSPMHYAPVLQRQTSVNVASLQRQYSAASVAAAVRLQQQLSLLRWGAVTHAAVYCIELTCLAYCTNAGYASARNLQPRPKLPWRHAVNQRRLPTAGPQCPC